MTVVSDLAAHLVANVTAVPLVSGTNLFVNVKPDSPATAVIVYQTSSIPPAHVYGSGSPAWRYRGFQIVSRAQAHIDAETLAENVDSVMLDIVNETVGSTLVLRCDSLQSPFPLQRDSQHRLEFVCNYVLSVQSAVQVPGPIGPGFDSGFSDGFDV